MLYLKSFTEEKAIIADTKDGSEFLVEAVGDQVLDRDLLEDILDYDYRMNKEENN